MATELQYVPFSGMMVYRTQDSRGHYEYVFDSVVKFGGGATITTSGSVAASHLHATDISGGDLTQSSIIRADEMKANSFSGGSFNNTTIKASNFSGSDISMIICGETYVVSGINLGLAGSGSNIHTHTYLILHNLNSVAGQTETESES